MKKRYIVAIFVDGVIVGSVALGELIKTPLERELEEIGRAALTDPNYVEKRIEETRIFQEKAELEADAMRLALCDAKGGSYIFFNNRCNVEEQCIEYGGRWITTSGSGARCQWSSFESPEQEDKLRQNCEDSGGCFTKDGSIYSCTVRAGWLQSTSLPP